MVPPRLYQLPGSMAILAFTLLSGCASVGGGRYVPTAFGHDKTYAVVSVRAEDEIEVDNGESSLNVGGLLDAIKGKSGWSKPVDKLLDKTAPLMIAELGKSRSFRLLPPEKVLQSTAYQAIEPDSGYWSVIRTVPPAGYKIISSSEKLKELARKLNVDGVITLTLRYFAAPTHSPKSDAPDTSEHHASVRIVASAFDNLGATVWQDDLTVASDKSIASTPDAVDFSKLDPYLVRTAVSAAKELVQDLDKALYNAEESSVTASLDF